MRLALSLAILLLAPALTAPAQAQLGGDLGGALGETPFQFSAVADRSAAYPGDPLRVAVIVDVAPLHKLYRNSIAVALPSPIAAEVISVDVPKGTLPHGEPGAPAGDNILIGRNVIIVTLRVKPEATGTLALNPRVSYQGCSDTACFPPDHADRSLALPVAASRDEVKMLHADLFPPAPVAEDLGALARGATGRSDLSREVASKGYFFALFAAFGSGFLVSLTPCVWPLIPIILAVVGAGTEGAGWRRGLGLSLVYVLGIALIYAALGAAAGALGRSVQGLTQTPWLVGIVCLVFVALALSMFGLYDIRVPSSVAGKLQGRRGTGITGVLIMGLASGLVASPCVSAPLLGLFAGVATLGSIWVGALAGFIFALGMGVILIVAGTSSKALAALPRSGEWMVAVKHFFGWVMLGAAAWFSEMVFGPAVYRVLMIAWCVAALLAVAWSMGGPGPVSRRSKAVRVGLVLVLVAGLIYFISDYSSARRAPIDWKTDLNAGLALAKSSGKPVLIDVTAEWCTYCKEMDRDVFARPDVAAEAQRFVMIRFDATIQTQAVAAFYKVHGVIGPPAFVFYPTMGEPVTVNGKQNHDTILRLMRAAR